MNYFKVLRQYDHVGIIRIRLVTRTRTSTNRYGQNFLKYAQDDIAEKQRRTYFAMKLDGQRVNAAGIELHLKMTATPHVVTSRIYLEQACVLTLRDGKMTKAFA